MNLFDWILGRRKVAPLGERGERRAADHVRHELGMAILETNVRCPHGELDIVARDGEDLVFIEVRTRGREVFGTPESTIRGGKRRKVVDAARWYIRTRKLGALRPRFDIIAIVWPSDGPPVLRHRRNAFYLSGRKGF